MILWKLDDVMRRKRVKGRALAARMGIGENYLSRVRHEGPERLSLSLLDTLCRELDCGVGDLLEYRPAASDTDPTPAPEAPEPAGVTYIKRSALSERLGRLRGR